MRNKILNPNHPSSMGYSKRGFTLIELMVSSLIMLIIILGTLSLYVKSNKISVDQQHLAELQHDVRAAMFFVSRDVRMAGVGLPIEFSGYFLEGINNESQGGDVNPDRLKIIGNIEDPLNLGVTDYDGVTVSLIENSFEQFPYSDSYYEDRIVIILPKPSSGCPWKIRQITHVTHSAGGTNEKLNFSPGQAPGINPPGGLSGTCDGSNDYDGGMITFIEVKEYWLDITGNYSGLLPGENGYIGDGKGGVLYLTQNGVHYPLAKNIENLQFQYNGDFDNDGNLDGFTNWDDSWTTDQVSLIREVKIWVLGKTPSPFVSVSGTPPSNLHLYRRPEIADSPKSSQDDKHRRFLLESTATVRNLSLSLYNTGTR